MMKRSKMKVLVLSVLTAGMVSISAFATSFGASSTMRVTSSSTWQTDFSIKDTKAYANVDTGKIKVSEKTMITTPTGKIVNSGKTTRSTSASLSGASTFYVNLTGCEKGYTYYLAVKPSSYQSGTDYITAQINVG